MSLNSPIFCISMGGHGALVWFLKNPGMYKSVSAFAPICNPVNCAWGKKAFGGYLGPNVDAWKEYDACELVRKYKGPQFKILADQVDHPRLSVLSNKVHDVHSCFFRELLTGFCLKVSFFRTTWWQLVMKSRFLLRCECRRFVFVKPLYIYFPPLCSCSSCHADAVCGL